MPQLLLFPEPPKPKYRDHVSDVLDWWKHRKWYPSIGIETQLPVISFYESGEPQYTSCEKGIIKDIRGDGSVLVESSGRKLIIDIYECDP